MLDASVDDVLVEADQINTITVAGEAYSFDALYSVLGSVPRSSLGKMLGAAVSEQGCFEIDAHQQTTVPQLYAAGDVAHSLDQISVTMGHAALAATAIHDHLREHEAW